MRRCWTVIYIVLQCTWGLVQTAAGFLLFLWYRRCPHEWFEGAVQTRWDKTGGISLGMFIFTPKRYGDLLTAHEYGHTIQSLILGPCYLLLVGLPSVIWARCPVCARWRKEKHLPYSWFVVEQWADLLGSKVIGHLRENEERRI